MRRASKGDSMNAEAQSKRKRGSDMKKKEEGEEDRRKKPWSGIRQATEGIRSFQVHHGQEGGVSTLGLLCVTNLLLSVLDMIGPTMLVLRRDLQRNNERVQDLYVQDPSLYSRLEEILKKESDEGTARKEESCSRALLWLARSIMFSLTLLRKLEEDQEASFEQMVEEAYSSTLKPWHGWISSAAYKVAVKLVPERQAFISLLKDQGQRGQDQDHASLKADIKNLDSIVRPLLDETTLLLVKYKLDNLKSP